MRRDWIVLVLLAVTPLWASDWRTDYEKSGCKRTPRYEQTIAYCKRLAQASPWVQYTTFGKSPQGRDLALLIVDRGGNFTARSVRRSGNAVFLIQAGVHAGEIDGKDAGLMLIRDIVIDKKGVNLLDHATILFVPMFNVDGHERWGPYQRPNQNGPEEMGWRTTATNLNLNRDFLKADTPEMRAFLRLYLEWLPDFYADCHVTDGADYQYVLTYAVEEYGNMDPALTAWVKKTYKKEVEERMAASGFPIIRYNWYLRRHDPRSGIKSWAAPPRFSTGYAAIQNRASVLIETHMLKDYKTRVGATYQMLRHTLEMVGRDHETLAKMAAAADRRAASQEFRGTPFPLTFERTADSVMIDFLGYDYEFVESDLTGGKFPRYSDRPTLFRIPYYYKQEVVKETKLPEGYIIPAEWSDVIERLEANGVAVHRLESPQTVEVQAFRLANPEWNETPFEGHQTVTYTTSRFRETRTYAPGSALVDMAQRASRVAAHCLEPDAPDSFVAWGLFNAIFERKEYIETYAIERVAREMLAADPQLRDEFEHRKASDPEFAADPQRIRDWFYRRSPYWDQRLGVYPVGAVTNRGEVDRLIRGTAH
jgi:murein tripeptide amidase MpaA